MKWRPLLLILILSCTASKKNPQNTLSESPSNSSTTFDKQGHRGCRGLLPENTIPAMRKALDLGVTTLEMDVVITADKQVVLSHEPFFNHEISTKPDGGEITAADQRNFNIYRMNYAEVHSFDVGLKPHPRFPRQQRMAASKPLLADVFDSVRQYMMTARRPFPLFNIETKCSKITDGIFHPAPAEFVDLLMAVVREKKMEEQTTIQSFDFRTLQYLHANYPGVQTAMLIDEHDGRSLDEQLAELGFVPTIYSPAYQRVTERLIEQCHAKGMKIIPWTVNTSEEMEGLKKKGVDGIISDYPDLFMNGAH